MKAKAHTWAGGSQKVIEVGGKKYCFVYGYPSDNGDLVVPDENRRWAKEIFVDVIHSMERVPVGMRKGQPIMTNAAHEARYEGDLADEQIAALEKTLVV